MNKKQWQNMLHVIRNVDLMPENLIYIYVWSYVYVSVKIE